MTWSITASGKKEEARATIEGARFSGAPDSPEGKAFEGVKAAFLALVDGAPTGASVSGSASGSGTYISASISVTVPA